LVFFKKKVDSGDPVKTQNLGLGPGQLLGVIIFCSIRFLSKKIIKQKFFIKQKTESSSNRSVSVRFGFFGQKLVQIGLARFFFRFGSVFSGLARFFFWFFRFGFGFFGFKFIKPNWTGRFFQNFNRFNRFFYYFFYFLGLISFSVCFAHPYLLLGRV
jgi:hypothetical protein